MTAMILMVRTNHRGPRINGTLQAFNQRHLIDTNWRSANHLVGKNKMVKMTSWVDLIVANSTGCALCLDSLSHKVKLGHLKSYNGEE